MSEGIMNLGKTFPGAYEVSVFTASITARQMLS